MTHSAHLQRPHDRALVYLMGVMLMVMVAGAATWAINANAHQVTNSFTSGTVSLGVNGAKMDAVTLGASGMLPGDRTERVLSIDNLGGTEWSELVMTTYVASGDDSSVLDTDPDLGLQMSVDRCSLPWQANGASFVCTGSLTSNVAAAGPVVRAHVPIVASPAMVPDGHDFLRITTALPANAGNEFLGQRTSLTMRFTAVQRTASTH